MGEQFGGIKLSLFGLTPHSFHLALRSRFGYSQIGIQTFSEISLDFWPFGDSAYRWGGGEGDEVRKDREKMQRANGHSSYPAEGSLPSLKI
jgi:hypothetical protein